MGHLRQLIHSKLGEIVRIYPYKVGSAESGG